MLQSPSTTQKINETSIDKLLLNIEIDLVLFRNDTLLKNLLDELKHYTHPSEPGMLNLSDQPLGRNNTSFNNLNDSWVQSFSTYLPYCKSVQHLNLSRTDLDDRDIDALIKATNRRSAPLYTLNVKYNEFISKDKEKELEIALHRNHARSVFLSDPDLPIDHSDTTTLSSSLTEITLLDRVLRGSIQHPAFYQLHISSITQTLHDFLLSISDAFQSDDLGFIKSIEDKISSEQTSADLFFLRTPLLQQKLKIIENNKRSAQQELENLMAKEKLTDQEKLKIITTEKQSTDHLFYALLETFFSFSCSKEEDIEKMPPALLAFKDILLLAATQLQSPPSSQSIQEEIEEQAKILLLEEILPKLPKDKLDQIKIPKNIDPNDLIRLFQTIQENPFSQKIDWDFTEIPPDIFKKLTVMQALVSCLRHCSLIDDNTFKLPSEILGHWITGKNYRQWLRPNLLVNDSGKVYIRDLLQSASYRKKIIKGEKLDDPDYLAKAIGLFLPPEKAPQKDALYYQFCNKLCQILALETAKKGQKSFVDELECFFLGLKVVQTSWLNAKPQAKPEKILHSIKHLGPLILIAIAGTLGPILIPLLGTTIGISALATALGCSEELLEMAIDLSLEVVKGIGEIAHAGSEATKSHGNPTLPTSVQSFFNTFSTTARIENVTHALPTDINDLNNLRGALTTIIERITRLTATHPEIPSKDFALRLEQYLMQGYFSSQDAKNYEYFVNKFLFLLTYNVIPSGEKNEKLAQPFITAGPLMAQIGDQMIIWEWTPNTVFHLQKAQPGGNIETIPIEVKSVPLNSAQEPQWATDWEVETLKNKICGKDTLGGINDISAHNFYVQNVSLKNKDGSKENVEKLESLLDRVKDILSLFPPHVTMAEKITALTKQVDSHEARINAHTEQLDSHTEKNKKDILLLKKGLRLKSDKQKTNKQLATQDRRITIIETGQEALRTNQDEQANTIESLTARQGTQDQEIAALQAAIHLMPVQIQTLVSELVKQYIPAQPTATTSSLNSDNPSTSAQADQLEQILNNQQPTMASPKKPETSDAFTETDEHPEASPQQRDQAALSCRAQNKKDPNHPHDKGGPGGSGGANGNSQAGASSTFGNLTLQPGSEQQAPASPPADQAGSPQGSQETSTPISEEKENQAATDLLTILHVLSSVTPNNKDIVASTDIAHPDNFQTTIPKNLKNVEQEKPYILFLLCTLLSTKKTKDNAVSLMVSTHTFEKARHRIHNWFITPRHLKDLFTSQRMKSKVKKAFSKFHPDANLKMHHHLLTLKKDLSESMQLFKIIEWLMEERDYPKPDFEACMRLVKETLRYNSEYVEKQWQQIFKGRDIYIKNIQMQSFDELRRLSEKDPLEFVHWKNHRKCQKIRNAGFSNELENLLSIKLKEAEKILEARQLEEEAKQTLMPSSVQEKSTPFFPALGLLMASTITESAIIEKQIRAKEIAAYDAYERYMVPKQQPKASAIAYDRKIVLPIVAMVASSTAIKEVLGGIPSNNDKESVTTSTAIENKSESEAIASIISPQQGRSREDSISSIDSCLSRDTIAGDGSREFKFFPLHRSPSSETIAMDNPSRFLPSESQVHKQARETIRNVNRQAFSMVSWQEADEEREIMESIMG